MILHLQEVITGTLNLEQHIPMDVLLKFTKRYQFDLKELLDF